ncbi:hypothetical protein B566_EDAN001548 [Ephemera danica]|nr:hypothetical protein B566_EDAN001548 [Ephemera danica]
MNKRGKPIQFGKIRINIPKEPLASGAEIENEVVEGGFGTFSLESGQGASNTEQEAAQMREVMGFSGFGKKAKSFNIEDMVDAAKKVAQEKRCAVADFVLTAEKLAPLSLGESSQSTAAEAAESDEEDLIGPPVPATLAAELATNAAEDSDSDSEIIGPMPPPPPSTSKTDSDSDDSDTEESAVSKIPASHEVSMLHGSRAVLALAVDPAGARLATGSVDYEVRFWDFAGMDSSSTHYSHPIKALQYSITGDLILVVAGNAQAKVMDRDGFEKAECVKGDQYITDMARTKGHVAALTNGTCRLWNMWRPQSHKNIVKCRAQNGLKTVPTACTYNRDGNLVACACNDGSIQMWDHRKQFVNTCMLLRNAHTNQTETSCIAFSYLDQYLTTRGGDDTLKLWDLRAFKKPVHVAQDLFSRYAWTECMFSPDDSLVVTGTSMRKGETEGKMIFFDRNTFSIVHEISVTNSHVIRTHWHQKLNQIFVGCGNGIVKAYYDDKKSLRGAKLCAGKSRKKVKQVESVATQQIITPHALPLFRQDKPKSVKKQMEKDRLDPVKSHRPELPITAKGQGGRVAASGGTLSSYVIRNLGLSKKIEDDQDPREAILRFAKEAAENPYWISPAYNKTQPKPIFQSQEEEEEDEPSSKKQKM